MKNDRQRGATEPDSMPEGVKFTVMIVSMYPACPFMM
jgi:hypothetical protein